jgi:glucose/arabinose dehydrogenase
MAVGLAALLAGLGLGGLAVGLSPARAQMLVESVAPLAPETVPANFVDEQVAAIGSPTALAFTPDGRMLVTRQGGELRVIQNDVLLATPALTLTSAVLCSNFERGLLGVAVDPQFAGNGYIYLYYTYRNGAATCGGSTTPVNRVARFTMLGNTAFLTSEVVLIDNIPSWGGNHNAGDLAFGNDGYLYVSVGDGGADYAGGGSGGSNDAARDRHVLLGKILRITRDGQIPPDNPFIGANTARCNVAGIITATWTCQETFAWGLRNPFRMAFDPNVALTQTRFFINDVGQNAWEEIDLAQSGADYGWNCREGAHTNNTSGPCNPTPANMVDPIYEYNHNTGCYSITGGAFVPESVWPITYTRLYLFGDYGCGTIQMLSATNGSTYTHLGNFATGLGSGGSVVAMRFGPYSATQALYYTTFSGTDSVRRIRYTGSLNQPPTAVLNANPTNGTAPLTVTLSAVGSSDPNNDPLTFNWAFGDGATLSNSAALTVTHVYTNAGQFTATVQARDLQGALSAPASAVINAGNTAPLAAILAPLTNTRFAVGQVITLTGVATDTQEGQLPASALSWEVWLYHIDEANPQNTHTHPFVPPTSGNHITFTAPPPEDFGATALSYLEVRLTAQDSLNAATLVTQTLEPNRAPLTFTTNPSGLSLIVNGLTITAPRALTGWEAHAFTLAAPDTQLSHNQWWAFGAWSHGGAASQNFVTPAIAAAYTATYQLQWRSYLSWAQR